MDPFIVLPEEVHEHVILEGLQESELPERQRQHLVLELLVAVQERGARDVVHGPAILHVLLHRRGDLLRLRAREVEVGLLPEVVEDPDDAIVRLLRDLLVRVEHVEDVVLAVLVPDEDADLDVPEVRRLRREPGVHHAVDGLRVARELTGLAFADRRGFGRGGPTSRASRGTLLAALGGARVLGEVLVDLEHHRLQREVHGAARDLVARDPRVGLRDRMDLVHDRQQHDQHQERHQEGGAAQLFGGAQGGSAENPHCIRIRRRVARLPRCGQEATPGDGEPPGAALPPRSGPVEGSTPAPYSSYS